MNSDEMACPYCAETIKIGAKLCRHCKASLVAPGQAPRPLAMPVKSGGGSPWLIIVLVLGGLFVFGAIVAAIAIPGLLAAQRAGGERNSSASLKMICTAEADFRANDRDGNDINDFWVADVRGLYTGPADSKSMIDLKLIELSTADADSGASPASRPIPGAKASPKSGYYFQMIVRDEKGAVYGGADGADRNHNNNKFGVCAYPAAYGASGKLTFVINEGYTMFKRDAGAGRAVQAFPNEMELQTLWSKMD